MLSYPMKNLLNGSYFSLSPSRYLSVLFFGSDLFSKSCLKALHRNQAIDIEDGKVINKLGVVCLPEKRTKLPVKQYALDENLPLYTWPALSSTAYDIGVVVSFGQLIPKNIIQQFKYGMINVHGSLLPRWRGATPLMQTILSGDKEAGISIMEIKPGKFDHGRILMSSEKVKVQAEWTSEDLGIALEDIASTNLLRCLGDIEYYLQNAKEQDKKLVTYAPKINPEDSIIIWDLMSAEEICKKYRAYGFKKDRILRTSFLGKKVKLQKICCLSDEDNSKLEILEKSTEGIVPGTIFFLKKTKTICVRCKTGYIGVTKLILGKPITANDFYNGSIQPLLKLGKPVSFN